MDIATLIGPDAVASAYLRFAVLHFAYGTKSEPVPEWTVVWNAILWLESGDRCVRILRTLDRSWLRLLGRQKCCKCRTVRVSPLFNPNWRYSVWVDEHLAIRDGRDPNTLRPSCSHLHREHCYCRDCWDQTNTTSSDDDW